MIAAVVLVVVATAFAVLGVLGLAERLPMNRFAGVRTTATMRDAEAFRVGNKVAGLPIAVAGVVGVLGGVLALVMPLGVAAGVLGAVGMLAITGAGGVLGHRAAQAVPEPEPELPAGCAGCACGGCGVRQLSRTSPG